MWSKTFETIENVSANHNKKNRKKKTLTYCRFESQLKIRVLNIVVLKSKNSLSFGIHCHKIDRIKTNKIAENSKKKQPQ